MDITKFDVNDEFQVFSDVVKLRYDLVKDNRFFFFYNKADKLEDGSFDENTYGKARNFVRGLLKEINPKMVEMEQRISCPISSREYLASTFLLTGKIHRLPRNHYNWITCKMFGSMNGIPNNFPEVIEEKDRDYLEYRKRNSSIAQVERNIFEALTLQAPRLFATTIVSSLNRIVQEMSDNLRIRVKAMNEDRRDVEKLIKRLIDSLLQIQNSKNDFTVGIKAFQEDFIQKNEEIAVVLTDELVSEISKILDKDNDSVSISYETRKEALEAALQELKPYMDRVSFTVAHYKRQADYELSNTIQKCDLSCQRIASRLIKNIISESLKESFPKKDFSEIIDQLQYVPELSYQPRVTWEAVKIDLDAMKLISVSSFEERISKKLFKRKASGFPVNPVGTVVGEICLAVLNVMTEDGTETVTRFKVNYAEMKVTFEEAIWTNVHNSFKRCLAEEGEKFFQLIQRRVQVQYFDRIKRLQEGLQGDLNKRNSNFQHQDSMIAHLEALRVKCDNLKETLSQPIELIIPSNECLPMKEISTKSTTPVHY